MVVVIYKEFVDIGFFIGFYNDVKIYGVFVLKLILYRVGF